MGKKKFNSSIECDNILLVAGGSKGNKSAANNQSKLIKLLNEIFDQVYFITFCDEEQDFQIPKNRIFFLDSYRSALLNFLFNQVREVKYINRILGNITIESVLFSFGQDLNLIPILYLKLLGKRVVLRSSGRPSKILSKYIGDKYRIKTTLFRIIEEINYRIVDQILTECEYAIKENDFEKYRKAYSANLFIDTNQFFSIKDYHEREFDVGYIGRFSEEKGVWKFLQSIPLLLHYNPGLKIFIAGEGDLKFEMINFIQEKTINRNITMHQWIPHKYLSYHLNEIKLLVIPSKREGLPNIALEAMASGTTVLATPVGSIPGVIINNKTGFILRDSNPETIAKGIEHAMNYSHLEKIVDNANLLVNEYYSFPKTIEQLRKVLCNVYG